MIRRYNNKIYNFLCIYNFNPGPFKKGAELSNGHLAFDGNFKLSIKFILYLSMPAQAIIAALSLQRFTGGKIEENFFSLDNLVKFSLIFKLAATPPAITKVFSIFLYPSKTLPSLFLFFHKEFH